MRSTYLILTRHGQLNIKQRTETGEWCCTYAGPSCEMFMPKTDDRVGQPFPEIANAEMYLAYAEKTINRIMPILRTMTIEKKMLIELCLGGGRGAIELFEDCPALALLLAQRISNDPSVYRCEQVVGLVAAGRGDLLQYCRYPNERWITKLLRKISASHTTPNLLVELKKILMRADPNQWKILRHLPRISSLVVSVLGNSVCAGLVSNRFYREAAMYPQQNGDIEVECLLGEIAGLVEGNNDITIPRINSVRELPALYDRVTAFLYEKKQNRRIDNRVFHSPPIPGGRVEHMGYEAGISPITTAEDLYLEGRYMNHCIGSYTDTIANNDNIYAYHVVLREEDATVLIARDAGGYRLVETRGINNRRVSSNLFDCVKQWLANHNNINMKIQERPERTLSAP